MILETFRRSYITLSAVRCNAMQYVYIEVQFRVPFYILRRSIDCNFKLLWRVQFSILQCSLELSAIQWKPSGQKLNQAESRPTMQHQAAIQGSQICWKYLIILGFFVGGIKIGDTSTRIGQSIFVVCVIVVIVKCIIFNLYNLGFNRWEKIRLKTETRNLLVHVLDRLEKNIIIAN